jgi:hypothetical protein
VFSATAYVIRRATEEDASALRGLSELDSQSPITAPALIGEIAGAPAAAISLADGRVVADPFQRTAALTPLLRLRARSLAAYERTPSVRERLIAGVRPACRAAGVTA